MAVVKLNQLFNNACGNIQCSCSNVILPGTYIHGLRLLTLFNACDRSCTGHELRGLLLLDAVKNSLLKDR